MENENKECKPTDGIQKEWPGMKIGKEVGKVAGTAEALKPVTKKPKLNNQALFYLTDFDGLLLILSTGLIKPSATDCKAEGVLNILCSSRLLLWSAQVPANVLPGCEEDSLEQPVIIELDSSRLKGSSVPFIDKDLKVGKGSITKVKLGTVCLLPAGAIPKMSIKKIYFPSKDIKEEILVRLEILGNLDLNGIDFDSSSELFKGDSLDNIEALKTAIKDVPPNCALPHKDYYARLNSLCGMISTFTRSVPPDRSWMDSIYAFFDCLSKKKRNKAKSGIDTICGYLSDMETVLLSEESFNPANVKGLELGLLHAAVHVLRDADPKEGLKLDGFISRLADLATSVSLSKEERNDLEEWKLFSMKLIEAKVKPQSLGDKPNALVRRAISLFIMRPSLDRIIKARSTSLQPGNAVFFLAVIFAGIYEGYSRIDRSIKQESKTNDIAILSAAMLCNRQAGEKFESFPVKQIEADMDESTQDEITKTVAILINSKIVASVQIGPGDAMRGLYSRAKSQGYNFEYNFEQKHFEYTFEYEEGRSQRVYITITESGFHYPKHMIRFLSPCLDIGKNKLTAGDKEGFLRGNSDRNMHCRYAIDEKAKQVVVIADQLLHTNDLEEFEYFCGEVARVADNYERKLGKDSF